MKTMPKIFLQQHKGIGGLYFTFTSIISAVIMTLSLQLSWDSQAVAIADNLAYIASVNTTVNSYIANVPAYDSVNPSIPLKSGGNYEPLRDFNEMIVNAGISPTGASVCDVKWTGSGAYIKMGEFETTLGTKVRPHQQESVIESY